MKNPSPVALPVVFSIFLTAGAQALELSDLAGRSIKTSYLEVLHTMRGSFQNTWHDQLYISAQNRIFHKVQFTSSSPTLPAVDRELVSGEGGGRFQLDGNSLVREWTNPRNNVHIRYEIVLNGSNVGATCQIVVTRINSSARIEPLGQSCRVVAGNIVGH
jgi:hypothetical protein